jgi:histone acetyltransferase (RNA polymerase elongator complex component)
LRHQNEQNTKVKVKVEKAGKSILDWYAINVSPDQNFSHIFEAISQASTHALNVSLFKEPVRTKIRLRVAGVFQSPTV